MFDLPSKPPSTLELSSSPIRLVPTTRALPFAFPIYRGARHRFSRISSISAISATWVLIRDIMLQWAFPKRSLVAMREKIRRGRWEETTNTRGCYRRNSGQARRKMERKEETSNFVLTLVGATLNCGLPTLINFERFISSYSIRPGEGRRAVELAR